MCVTSVADVDGCAVTSKHMIGEITTFKAGDGTYYCLESGDASAEMS